MLRIVEEQATDSSITLRLDGRLVSRWVEVLRSSCEQAFQHGSRLRLDLAGVSFADREGLNLLRQLQAQQVSVINCPPLLREQLKPSPHSFS